jgi:hypothetical protein
MTGEEKAIAEEDAEIAGLVAVVVGKPINEAAGAVGKLGAMKRGRPELVKALHRRRESARERLAGGVRFDNQTLITLKAELDKRRAEALDFIEDEARYPDRKKMEAEGKLAEYMKIQKEQVDTRVDAVREIWDNPYVAAMNSSSTSSRKSTSGSRARTRPSTSPKPARSTPSTWRSSPTQS